MELVLFLVWLVIWALLLAMSTVETRGMVFGFIAGLWIMLLGCYILVDGLFMETGSMLVASGSDYIITYTQTEVVPPFSSYGVLWCFPFVCIGMYLMYLAVTMKRKSWGKK